MNITKRLILSLGIIFAAVIAVVSFLPNGKDGGFVAQITGTGDDALPMEEISYSPIVEEVNVSALSVYALDGGEVQSFRADKRWPIASITQLMTALIADRLYLQEKPYTYIPITEEAFAIGGETSLFRRGEEIRADDLIEAMMFTSDKVAAAALSINHGRENFVAEMNKMASDIGMTNTTFVDATGESLQNLSTAEDLARLTKFVFENAPYIFDLSRNKAGSVVDRTDGSKTNMKNTNEFAGTPNFLGGKDGGALDVDGSLISLFRVDERSENIIIVILGSANRFLETEQVLNNL